MEPSAHVCRYSSTLKPGAWHPMGQEEEREWARVTVCRICGRVRVPRRAPRPERIEQRAIRPLPPPASARAGQLVANELARRGGLAKSSNFPAGGLLGTLSRRGIAPSLAEQWINNFVLAGWIEVTWILRGERRALKSILVSKRAELEEFAHPGAAEAWTQAIDSALEQIRGLSHPVARDVEQILQDPATNRLPLATIRALAAVAIHAERGDTLAARVFSARYLGDSKALSRCRSRLVRLLGPLEELGIREGGSITLLGGTGVLDVAGGAVSVKSFGPFLGLSRDTLDTLRSIDLPSGGLFIVENQAVFEACCRSEVEAVDDHLIVWSAGYPGRAARSLVEAVARVGGRITVWADLDLDGIRIARLVHEWSGGSCETYKMAPEDLKGAPTSIPLSTRAVAKIASDLSEKPSGWLHETLETMLSTRRWVEQEAFLGSAGTPGGQPLGQKGEHLNPTASG